MTEKHSPLPWIAASKFSSVVGVPIVNQTGQHVANTSMPGLPEEWPDHRKQRAEANAALIVQCVNGSERIASMWDYRLRIHVRKDYPLLAEAIDKLVGGLINE